MTTDSAAGGGDGHRVGQDATASGHAVVVQAGRDSTVTVHHGDRARVAWPVRVGVPPPPADHHQDRRAYALLVEVLTSGRAAVVVGAPQHAGVVVSGLGGVGKSQLAARHAWSVWADPVVDVAVWVSALSRDAIVTAYAEAATRVLVEQDPLIADRPPEQAAGRFREWLAATPRRWLIVLDDVQDPADLRGLDPPPGSGGQVVVTSRRRDAVVGRRGHRVIELDVFTPHEALAYLTEALAGTTDGGDRDKLAGLADELGCLPLALSQAAAYLVDQPLLTVTAYRAMLADKRRTLAELTPPEHALPEHQATIAVTWAVSIDRADRADDPARPRGAGLARPLLEIAALLDPNGIPLTAFTAPPVLDHLTTLTGRPVDPDDVHDGLTRLHRFNLITLTPDRHARAVAVHALVQRTVRDTLTPKRLHTLVRTSADALHTIWPDIDTLHPDLAQALRSNTTTLHAHTTAALLTPSLHDVLKRAGNSLGVSGQVHAAIAYWHTLHNHTDSQLGPDHLDTLTTRSNLARRQGEAGDPAGAITEYEALLADQLRVLGPDHPHTLTTRSNLASWRGEAGDPAGAVTGCEALLADRLRVLGPDHPDTLATRNNLAHWRAEAGDPAGAVTEYEALLADQLRVLGPDHPHTLITRSNLASWRGEAGDPAGAVTEYEALLADRLRVLGPDHPDTLITRNNLAHWRAEAGDPAGAVAELEALLPDQLRVLGPDHPDTLITRNNLARWQGRAGDPAGAVTELEALLADQLRVLGPDHPHTLATRSNLASWRGEAGDPAGAVTEYEALLADQLRVLGPDHPDTLATRNNLAHWRAEAGDPAGAVAEYEALLPDQLRVLGPDHPDTLATRNNLARWQGRAGDPAGAVTEYEALLADGLRVLGPNHPDTLTTRNNLASWRGRAGDPAGAVTEYEALLADQLRVLGPNHPSTLTTRNNLTSWREAVARGTDTGA
ncbi:tetratricopeptide repeat protein [Saccharothrix sp.]|uniref:tetratricopeptide repeat protein n=1 Tax=Saccharothrix sp. TaxID=1873460 RepID=UPI002811330A|nr:tetratricopeptide repeat protein [Saccharothrix sp.]